MAFNLSDLGPGQSSRLLRRFLELKRLTDLVRRHAHRGLPGADDLLSRNERLLGRVEAYYHHALDAFKGSRK